MHWLSYDSEKIVRKVPQIPEQTYPNGTAAAEEGDREDDRTKDDHHDGNNCGIVFRERTSDVIEFEQRNSANNNQRNSSDLKQTHKPKDIVYLIATLIFSKVIHLSC